MSVASTTPRVSVKMVSDAICKCVWSYSRYGSVTWRTLRYQVPFATLDTKTIIRDSLSRKRITFPSNSTWNSSLLCSILSWLESPFLWKRDWLKSMEASPRSRVWRKWWVHEERKLESICKFAHLWLPRDTLLNHLTFCFFLFLQWLWRYHLSNARLPSFTGCGICKRRRSSSEKVGRSSLYWSLWRRKRSRSTTLPCTSSRRDRCIRDARQGTRFLQVERIWQGGQRGVSTSPSLGDLGGSILYFSKQVCCFGCPTPRSVCPVVWKVEQGTPARRGLPRRCCLWGRKAMQRVRLHPNTRCCIFNSP